MAGRINDGENAPNEPNLRAANRAILAERTQFPRPRPNGEPRDFGRTNPISKPLAKAANTHPTRI